MCIAVDIVHIYIDILDLLLYTTCGSLGMGKCLGNKLALLVIRENGALTIQKCCGDGISCGTLERYELKKPLLDIMGFVSVVDHKHQLTLSGNVHCLISLDGDKVCTPDFFNYALFQN